MKKLLIISLMGLAMSCNNSATTTETNDRDRTNNNDTNGVMTDTTRGNNESRAVTKDTSKTLNNQK
jgi:hypothetical protein